MYADLGAKGDGNEFHLSFTGADNFVGASAAAPVELLAARTTKSWAARDKGGTDFTRPFVGYAKFFGRIP